MTIKNLIILDYIKLKKIIIFSFFSSLVYFFFLFLSDKLDLEIFTFIVALIFINLSLFFIYFSNKKELDYFPIYPLIILYYFVTYTAYFYLDYSLEPIYSLNFPGDDVADRFISPEIKKIILIICIGLVSFSFGYFILNYFDIKKKNLQPHIILGQQI